MSSRKNSQPPREGLEVLGRRMGGRAIMFHQAVADHLGLNMSDLKCWDLCAADAPITPGRIAELTGLTTGAITGIIDRLEKAGFVRRQPDGQDRRRILIHPVPGRQREVGRLFESLARAMGALASEYNSEQLALIGDFLSRAEKLMYEETLKLRAELEKAEAKTKARAKEPIRKANQ